MIWGVGLIGGSLGMAWRRSGAAAEVVGIGRRPLETALRLGAVDRYVTDPEEGIAEADVLVLAGPVGAIIQQAAEYGHLIRPGTIVTDVGSTKAAIVRAWEEHLPQGATFVGGHPMFGREQAGVENASPDLPAGCRYILTPTVRSDPRAVEAVADLARAAGAVVRRMSPEEHDARVAVISHLPQLVATALAATAGEEDRRLGGVLDLAAGGFRDTTRVASSPAGMWADIFLTNAGAIQEALAQFQAMLERLSAAVARGDRQVLEETFAWAREARNRIPL
ncbi:MAG TPA: prephenate dehydrogenase/arogenate dehydrogenase family protein [Symbiobacteriaceae bacterium]